MLQGHDQIVLAAAAKGSHFHVAAACQRTHERRWQHPIVAASCSIRPLALQRVSPETVGKG